MASIAEKSTNRQPGRLERWIKALFPVWSYRRALARLRVEALDHRRHLASVYAAAERNRLTYDWPARNTSSDGAIVPDLTTLNARARACVRDDWAAAAIVAGWVRHVVGTGFSCRANARDPWTGKPFEIFNWDSDRLWRRWCQPRFCDLEGKKSFRSMLALLVSERVQVGEGFLIVREVDDPTGERARARVPRIVLQAFEPEMLDETILQNPDNGHEIRHGVEIDLYGRPVAYWVYTDRHPLDTSFALAAMRQPRGGTESERVPAEHVLHLARWDRPRQTHGVSRLAAVLSKLRHLQMYDEYQLVAARLEACYGATIEIDPSVAGAGVWGLNPSAGEDGKDGGGNPVVEFEPGMFQRLAPGEKANWHVPKRPGDLYEPFVQAQVHQAATGAGLDYVTVTRDFSGGTYSGQRQGMIERDYEICPEQQEIIDVICTRVRDAVIAAAILEGLLEAPGWAEDPELMEAYLQAEWRPQAKPWIDPANQAQAAETALRNRLTTRRDVLNELGEDWQEVFQQLADEERELRRLGLVTVEPDSGAQGTESVSALAHVLRGLDEGGRNGRAKGAEIENATRI